MVIDPKVFTPHHYTSENCMLLYKQYATEGCSVLDVGTGTGILAMKAKEYGAGRVLAVDIQDEAVANAKANCEPLGIEVRKGYLNWDIDEKFDVTLANLYETPSVEFLQYAQNTMKDDGILILTWYNELSYFIVEERFKILDKIKGKKHDVYVLKAKERDKE